MPETHPNAQELADYGQGKLPTAEAARVAAHVEGCGECRGRLARRSPGGTLMPSGKTAPALPPGPDAPPPELASSGKYEVLGKIGEGGMGDVWKANQTWLGRAVAIKVLGGAALSHPEARERFRLEMLAGGRLDHPNIVKTHDAEQVGDVLLLVMEYIDGVTLDRLVKKKGPLPAALACRCARQAAEGLQYAHERGLVHRDIKPANLMLTREKQVKVLDFGLARMAAAKGEERRTELQVFMGTADYVSPEQAVNARDADIRSDIYSLGCTLYFLLSGKPPFQGDSAYEVAAAQMTDDPSPLTTVPAGLWAVVAKMMAKKPARRYQTPAEVVEALRPFTVKKESGPVSLPPPVPPAAPARRRGGRRWWLLPAAGAVGAALGLAALLLLPSPSREEVPDEPAPLPKAVAKAEPASPGAGPAKPPTAPQDAPPETLPPPTAENPEPAQPPREVASLPPFARPLNAVVLLPGGRTLLAVQLGPPPAESTYWDWGTRRRVGMLANRHKGAINGVAASPSGKVIATWGGTARRPETWELILTSFENGGVLLRQPLGGPFLGAFAFGPDEKRLMGAAGRDDDLRVWDLARGLELPRVRPKESSPPDPGRAGPRAISRTLRYAAAGLRDGRLRVWDTDSGKAVSTFQAAGARADAVAFSPDEKLVATRGQDETPRVWDLGGRELFRVPGDPKDHFRMAFTPDGRRLLTGGAAGWVDLWDLAGGKRVLRYPGHDGDVTALAVSADGEHFASAGADRVLRVWALPK